MPCPDPEELARYSDGLVTGALRDSISAHVDGCASCREVLVTMVRTQGPDDLPPPDVTGPDGEKPKRGDVIGRYVVLDARGAGGMGLVLSAHDSQLDRKVALKLVRPDIEEQGGAEKTKARLLREAQLMARVRHPNVVTVYDVGTLGNRIFIAMELVDGVTLRAWMKENTHPLDEVLAVFLQAGRGLAAAHSAGVVHRDFKPDNVLIDAGGGAHVTDFGIAWSHVLPAASPDPASTPSAEASGVKGTPAYMAPEQMFQEATDARTDQFSFCVALYEGVTGQRPFVGLDRKPLGPLPKKVPARLEAALRRGLSVDPALRFADMESLLREIAPRSKRAVWLSLGAAAAVIAAAAGTFALTWQPSDCETGPARLKGVWDDGRRAEIHQAFVATGATFADTAFDSAATALDRRTGEWLAAFRTSCERAPNEETRSRQRVCLDARLGELRALTDLFARADPRVVERAAEAAARLKGPQGCLQGEGLATLPLPDDPQRRAEIAQVRLKIAESEAQHLAGHLAAAIDLARAAIEMAKATKYSPVVAEAWLSLVEPLRDQGAYDEARRALDDAAIAAEAGRHFEALMLVSVKHVRVIDSAHTEEADTWIKRAEAALHESRQPELQAHLDSVVANLRLAQRRTGEAIARAAAARKFYETQGRAAEALGEWHITALAQRARGEPQKAKAELEQAVTEYEKVLGPTHPLTLHVRVHVAEAALDLGQAEAVLQLLEDRSFEAMTPSWQAMRDTLRGDALRMLGRWDEALEMLRRAVDEASSGSGGVKTSGLTRLHLAAALRELERFDEAEAELVLASGALEKTTGATSLPPHLARLELAELRLAQGRGVEANELAAAAIKRLRELIEDPGAPERLQGLLTAASAAVAVKDFERGRLMAVEAMSIANVESVTAARAKIRRGLAPLSPAMRESAQADLAEAFGVLQVAGVFPLDQLKAVGAVTCAELGPLQHLKLPPEAAKVLAKRCPK